MDWPSRLVIQKSGESYVKLFELEAVDSLENLQTSLENQILIRGEGEDGNGTVCCKSYLVRISGYFRSFVERWNNDNSESAREIKLENIPLDVFKDLLELASTGSSKLRDHSDLSTFVGAANFLEMAELSDRFSKLIRDEIANDNSSVILWCYMTPEEYHGYVGLSGEVSEMIKANFEDILASCSEQFMEMSGKQWLDLISDPDLFVISEDVLFRTISRWVAVDSSKRSDDFAAMAKFIRGSCLSKSLVMELRNASSTPSVIHMFIRKFIARIKDSSKSQPRTVEVLGFLPCGDDAESDDAESVSCDREGEACVLLCYDPFTRSKKSVSLTLKFDAKNLWTRTHSSFTSNAIHLIRDDSLKVVHPIREKWIPEVAHRTPYTYVKAPYLAEAAYLDGSVYMALWDPDSSERGYFKFDCTDSNVTEILNVPVHLRNLENLSFIGLAGKIHIFSSDGCHTYDPSNGVWSAAIPVTPPFEGDPERCCIGPDGMIYILVDGETKLWIFNVATLEFHVSGDCNERIGSILNGKNRIACVVTHGPGYVLCLYDHVKDLWTKRREFAFDEGEKFVPVRVLTSAFHLSPQKRAKRPLED